MKVRAELVFDDPWVTKLHKISRNTYELMKEPQMRRPIGGDTNDQKYNQQWKHLRDHGSGDQTTNRAR